MEMPHIDGASAGTASVLGAECLSRRSSSFHEMPQLVKEPPLQPWCGRCDDAALREEDGLPLRVAATRGGDGPCRWSPRVMPDNCSRASTERVDGATRGDCTDAALLSDLWGRGGACSFSRPSCDTPPPLSNPPPRMWPAARAVLRGAVGPRGALLWEARGELLWAVVVAWGCSAARQWASSPLLRSGWQRLPPVARGVASAAAKATGGAAPGLCTLLAAARGYALLRTLLRIRSSRGVVPGRTSVLPVRPPVPGGGSTGGGVDRAAATAEAPRACGDAGAARVGCTPPDPMTSAGYGDGSHASHSTVATSTDPLASRDTVRRSSMYTLSTATQSASTSVAALIGGPNALDREDYAPRALQRTIARIVASASYAPHADASLHSAKYCNVDGFVATRPAFHRHVAADDRRGGRHSGRARPSMDTLQRADGSTNAACGQERARAGSPAVADSCGTFRDGERFPSVNGGAREGGGANDRCTHRPESRRGRSYSCSHRLRRTGQQHGGGGKAGAQAATQPRSASPMRGSPWVYRGGFSPSLREGALRQHTAPSHKQTAPPPGHAPHLGIRGAMPPGPPVSAGQAAGDLRQRRSSSLQSDKRKREAFSVDPLTRFPLRASPRGEDAMAPTTATATVARAESLCPRSRSSVTEQLYSLELRRQRQLLETLALVQESDSLVAQRGAMAGPPDAQRMGMEPDSVRDGATRMADKHRSTRGDIEAGIERLTETATATTTTAPDAAGSPSAAPPCPSVPQQSHLPSACLERDPSALNGAVNGGSDGGGQPSSRVVEAVCGHRAVGNHSGAGASSDVRARLSGGRGARRSPTPEAHQGRGEAGEVARGGGNHTTHRSRKGDRRMDDVAVRHGEESETYSVSVIYRDPTGGSKKTISTITLPSIRAPAALGKPGTSQPPRVAGPLPLLSGSTKEGAQVGAPSASTVHQAEDECEVTLSTPDRSSSRAIAATGSDVAPHKVGSGEQVGEQLVAPQCLVGPEKCNGQFHDPTVEGCSCGRTCASSDAVRPGGPLVGVPEYCFSAGRCGSHGGPPFTDDGLLVGRLGIRSESGTTPPRRCGEALGKPGGGGEVTVASASTWNPSAPLPALAPTSGPRLEGSAGRRGEYIIGAFLGGGACGKVYECVNRETGQLLAVKQIIFNTKNPSLRQHLRHFQVELDVLSLAKQRAEDSIIGFYGAEKRGHTALVYLEYASRGSLLDFIEGIHASNSAGSAELSTGRGCGGDQPQGPPRAEGMTIGDTCGTPRIPGARPVLPCACPRVSGAVPLGAGRAARIIYQVVRGLAFMHANGYAHLDVKTANVLIIANGDAKLSDFGCSLRVVERSSGSSSVGELPEPRSGCASAETISPTALTARDLEAAGAPFSGGGVPGGTLDTWRQRCIGGAAVEGSCERCDAEVARDERGGAAKRQREQEDAIPTISPRRGIPSQVSGFGTGNEAEAASRCGAVEHTRFSTTSVPDAASADAQRSEASFHPVGPSGTPVVAPRSTKHLYAIISELQELQGTALYMAPEMIRFEREHIGTPGDVWSLGCLAMEILTGEAPWTHVAKDKMRVLFKIGSAREELKLPGSLIERSEAAKWALLRHDEAAIPQALAEDRALGAGTPMRTPIDALNVYCEAHMVDFLQHCLMIVPEKRWTAERLLRHPFLSWAATLTTALP